MTLQTGRFKGVRDAFVDCFAFVPGQLESIAQLQFGADGTRLWGVRDSERLRAWSVPDRRFLVEFDNSKNPMTSGSRAINAIAVSEKWILLGCNDGAPRLMSAADLNVPPQMWVLPFTADPIKSVAFNHDATLAAVGTFNGRLWVASVPSGQTVAELVGHELLHDGLGRAPLLVVRVLELDAHPRRRLRRGRGRRHDPLHPPAEAEGLGQAAHGAQTLQHPRDTLPRQRGVYFHGEAFAGEVIDHIQQPKPPAIRQLVAHEIQSPTIQLPRDVRATLTLQPNS